MFTLMSRKSVAVDSRPGKYKMKWCHFLAVLTPSSNRQHKEFNSAAPVYHERRSLLERGKYISCHVRYISCAWSGDNLWQLQATRAVIVA